MWILILTLLIFLINTLGSSPGFLKQDPDERPLKASIRKLLFFFNWILTNFNKKKKRPVARTMYCLKLCTSKQKADIWELLPLVALLSLYCDQKTILKANYSELIFLFTLNLFQVFV